MGSYLTPLANAHNSPLLYRNSFKNFLPLQNLFAVPNHPTFELLNFTCKHPVLLPY